MKKILHESPISNDEHVVIEAMADINPQLCKKLGLKVCVVQGGEEPIPHIHVYLDGNVDPTNAAYIRLDEASYSEHHSKTTRKLSRKQKERFIDIMKSTCPKQFHESSDGTVRRATGYEAAVDIWVDTYEEGSYDKFKVNQDGDPIMPDYSQL